MATSKPIKTDHICTTDSLLAGGEEMLLYCYLCNKKTDHTVGYGGMKCRVCGLYMWDFDDFSDAYKKLKGNMQRKDIAKKLKLSVNTISTYQGSRYGLWKLCEKLKKTRK